MTHRAVADGVLQRRGTTDERGAVAIVVALSLTALLVVTAMVLDFGLVRFDRQQVKLAADSAVMSGLRAADGHTGQVFSYRGVCGALAFLKVNRTQLSGLPSGVCASPNNSLICNAANPATQVAYTGTTTSQGVTSQVTIKLPYDLSDGAFPEETLPTLASDTADACNQLGIIIQQSRAPGLGSLATGSDLVFRQRSVGRVATGDGELSPALHLLERSECDVLTVGSSGSPSRIKVYGSTVTDVPATIHSDSAATAGDCGSNPNEQLYQGKQTGGVVAYGSSSGTTGVITSVATANGVPSGVVYDNAAYVYGTTAANESAAGGTTSTVSPRGLVTRRLVDERYLGVADAALVTRGVTQEVRDAYSQWSLNPASPGSGYTRFGCPTAADMTTMAGLGASDSVYIDCDGSGITLTGTIGAGRIYFHGFIKGGKLRLPNATQVYIDNTNDAGNRDSTSGALQLSTGTGFCVGPTATSGCDTLSDPGACPPSTQSTQTDLVVRRGAITSNGDGLLRLCNTRVIMVSGQLGTGSATSPGGCLPTSNGGYLSDPTGTTPPCPGASTSKGTGLVTLGGVTDWTAPNRYADMTAAGLTPAQKQAAWDAGEDLALWSETYGDGPDFKMAGGGLMNVAGVFVVPNAEPFTITGSGDQDLTDAQFFTRKFAVDGGAILTMQVDPYNSVALPELDPFMLVR